MHQSSLSLYLCAILSLFFAISTNGQSTITGAITNEKGEALPYANVVLLSKPDSTFMGGTNSDERGAFELTLDSGKDYILAVHLLGFQSAYQPIRANPTQLNIPTIVLIEGDIELHTVEVTAEKPLFVQTIDRTIVNLENRVVKVGASVLEVLEKLPRVIVDRQNETISLLGKDGLTLLINDRQQYLGEEALFNYLSGLNADNLRTVELITTPPANFDAEGNAGFINLQLKQYPGDGWNGSYALTGGYGNGEVMNGSVDFNYRKKPWTIAANYAVSHHGQGQFSTIERRVGSGANFLGTSARLDRMPAVNNQNLRLAMDYQLKPKTRLGSVFTTYLRHWNMAATYDIVFQPLNAMDTLIDARVFEENDWKSLQGNLNFSHEWNEQTSISADFDYLWFDNVNPVNYTFNYQLADGQALPGFDLLSDKKTPFAIQVGRIDFHHQASPELQWSAGAKTSVSTFMNDIRVVRNQIELANFTSISDLREVIGAVYTQFDFKLSDQVQFKGGLRYEYSDTDLGNAMGERLVDREFGTLFPTFYAQFGSFNLAYSKRINRPSFREMAPFQIFVGPNTSNTGNPALQPAISHNIAANYRWKTISLNLQYNKEDSTIASFQNRFDPTTNRQTILPSNLQQEEYIAFSVSSPVTLTPWWSLLFFADYFYIEAETQEELGTFKLNQNGFSANINQVFNLKKALTFEISAFYRSIGLNGNVRTQPYGGINIGLQKKLANGAQVSFNVSDLLETVQSIGVTDLPNQSIYVARLTDFSNRTFRISYQYSFGDNQVEKMQNIRQAEERRRVN